MATTILFPQFFLPFESIKLGRFITSVEYPHQDFHDPPYTRPPAATVTIRNQYNSLRHESNSSGFTSALTSLMSAGFSKRANLKLRVSTDHVRTYTLENSQRWFEEAAGFDDTRQWIERTIDQGDDAYLIVGFHTVTDARIIHQSAVGAEQGGYIGLPVGLSLTAVGIVAPLGDIIDPRIGTHRREADGVLEQFLAPGEQICALQYRKVCHRWLSSKKMDKASLAKVPRWTAGDRWRNEEEGEEDVIEVDAQDGGLPDGEWNQERAPDGETLIIRSS